MHFAQGILACVRTLRINLINFANKMIVQTRMESDGTVVLTVVVESLTSANAAEFRDVARSVIATSAEVVALRGARGDLAQTTGTALETTAGRVVVDCSQLEFIDSSGVGALLHVNNLLPESRRPVRLTGVGTRVLTTLELMRVHRQFELEP